MTQTLLLVLPQATSVSNRANAGLGGFQVVVEDLFFLSRAGFVLGFDQVIDQDLQHRPDDRNGEQGGEQNEFESKHTSSVARLRQVASRGDRHPIAHAARPGYRSDPLPFPCYT